MSHDPPVYQPPVEEVPATEPLIRLTGLEYEYLPGEPVLDGLDLELFPGRKIGLKGDNGTGKTTLLRIIVGLLKPRAGEIFAFGRARHEEPDFHEVRAKAGLLFQDPEDQLFSPTVLEDVAFGPLNLGRSRDEARAIAERTLASLGLEGYGPKITYRLSGGQKRLVSLAAVLAMEPRALLLDEPAVGLDEKSVGRVKEILQGLDLAMLVVSHRPDFLNGLVTGSVIIEDGRLA